MLVYNKKLLSSVPCDVLDILLLPLPSLFFPSPPLSFLHFFSSPPPPTFFLLPFLSLVFFLLFFLLTCPFFFSLPSFLFLHSYIPLLLPFLPPLPSSFPSTPSSPLLQVICQPCYGGVNKFVTHYLQKMNVELTWVKGSSIEQYKQAVKSNTKVR